MHRNVSVLAFYSGIPAGRYNRYRSHNPSSAPAHPLLYCGHKRIKAALKPGVKLAAVVKSNAYGLGIQGIVPALSEAGADLIAVSCKDGLLGCDGKPRVDKVFGLHLMPHLPAGTIGVKKGILNGPSTALRITVRGRAGHGAYPESGVDAVMVAAQVLIALQTVVSRRISPLDQGVVSIGRGEDAGHIENLHRCLEG